MQRLLVALVLVAGCGTKSGGSNVLDVKLDVPDPKDGFQLAIPAYDVPAGTEIQACYFFTIPGNKGDDVWVDHYQIAQTTGSHHMNLFRIGTVMNLVPTTDGTPVVNGQCFVSSNWSDWPLIVNSQQDATTDWQLPAGVGAKFKAGDTVMLQSHYVNATTQQTPAKAKVLVNLLYPKTTPTNELSTLFATNQNIRVCPGDTNKSFTKTCMLNAAGVQIIAANGHFHSRGIEFDMFAVDPMGNQMSQFYTSTAWNDPPMTRDIDVSLPTGGGVQWKCTYDVPSDACGNPDDSCCFTFGGHVDSQEHCNAFVYYYGATLTAQDINCF
jgi:hypothetical protein